MGESLLMVDGYRGFIKTTFRPFERWKIVADKGNSTTEILRFTKDIIVTVNRMKPCLKEQDHSLFISQNKILFNFAK